MPRVSASNPRPVYYEALREEFVVSRTIYDDNGADYKLQNGGAGMKRWVIKYDGLTADEAAIFDAHVDSAFYSPDEGSAFGFQLHDYVTDVLYGSVHYAPGGYRTSHTRGGTGGAGCFAREIILEKRG